MRVAVVGLGIAGMRAAMLLERAGVEVELFEARDRLGGRMQTVDHGDGAVYEAGGEWLDSDHERCLGLARELGLSLDSPNEQPRVFVCDGERCTEDSLWPEAVEDEIRFEAAAREMCRNLSNPPWKNQGAHDLDAANLASFIESHALSARGRWLLTAQRLSDEGDDPERIGLLGWLGGYLNYLQRTGGEMSAYQIAGGARELFSRMTNSVQVEPRLGAVLERVRDDGEAVTLSFSEFEAGAFDRVVLTLPPRPLERIVFESPLSAEKRCAIEACRMSRVIKVCFEFRSRWWSEEGWDGSMQCDLPIQQTWEGSRGSAAVLTAYVCGSEVESWLSSSDPVAWGVAQLASLYPRAEGEFVCGWVHDWVSDPFAGGGFSHTAPGYVLSHMRDIAPPEGRVHFAGEHTSPWVGFIEGALESAERVVGEILA